MTTIYHYFPVEGCKTSLSVKKPLNFDQLKEHIGGTIEFVSICDDIYACISNESKKRDLKANPSYPQFLGPVILGKLTSRGTFNGVK